MGSAGFQNYAGNTVALLRPTRRDVPQEVQRPPCNALSPALNVSGTRSFPFVCLLPTSSVALRLALSAEARLWKGTSQSVGERESPERSGPRNLRGSDHESKNNYLWILLQWHLTHTHKLQRKPIRAACTTQPGRHRQRHPRPLTRRSENPRRGRRFPQASTRALFHL